MIKKEQHPFPAGIMKGDKEEVLHKWGVQSMPWLVLTDHKHVVSAEGFGLGNQQGLEAGDNGRIGGFPSLLGPFVGKVNLREMTVGQPSGITHIPSASQKNIGRMNLERCQNPDSRNHLE